MAESKNDKTKAELQDELEAAGQPTTGTKAELEDRVEDLSRAHVPDQFIAQVRPDQ